MEFGAVIAIGACLAVAGLNMVQAALALPFEMVAARLEIEGPLSITRGAAISALCARR